MSEVSMKKSFAAGTSYSNEKGERDLISYVEEAFSLILGANMKALRNIMTKLHINPTEEGFGLMMNELDELFDNFNAHQTSVIKQSVHAYVEGGSLDLTEFERLNEEQDDLQKDLELVIDNPTPENAGPLPGPDSNTTKSSQQLTSGNRTTGPPINPDSGSKVTRKWSDTWKQTIESALNMRRRQRVRDRAIKKVGLGPIQVVPKSNATKERLRNILSTHYLLADLEYDLQEEIIDAFQDVRVSAGTEIIKQGDIADNFYIIDVGDFDILDQKGNEPPVLLRNKGAGDSLGELALMYDTKRNVTVKATTNALLWAVNRAEFKSILTRHLTGSPIAQVLRETPAFKKLHTRDIIKLSNSCNVAKFRRGQNIMKAGTIMDKVCIVQEGQVRMTWGATVGNAMPGRGAIGGETLALMDRLEVLGEAVLLNDDTNNSWNFTAAAEQVDIISMSRSLLTKDMMTTIRKGLQIQLAAIGLQRVPAFLELNNDQILCVAQKLTESSYPKGEDITRYGDALGSDARIYVVQWGTVMMHKSPILDDKIHVNSAKGDAKLDQRASKSGSFLLKNNNAGGNANNNNNTKQSTQNNSKGGDNNTVKSAPDQSASNASGTAPSSPTSAGTSTSSLPSPTLKPQGEQQGGVDRKSLERRANSLQPSQPWTFPTYGVFGDECLQNSLKHEAHKAIYSATTVAESSTIVLSVSLADVISVLGPIQDLLSRISNLKTLRKVKHLEYLTSNELDKLSHSMGIRVLRPGEVVYKAGEPGDRLYIIKKGTVVESMPAPAKGEPNVLSKGAIFGEDALISNEPRLSTMVSGPNDPPATSGTELYYLDRAVLEANLGSLQELNEIRKHEAEKRGIVKSITFEELHEIGLLGTGLFGKVKLVYNKKTKEHYALKCVSKAKVVRMNEEEHLRNEKMHMAELDHPFINKLIRTFKDQNYVYLLEELTPGRELFLFLQRVGRLQEWEAAFYAGGVLLALEYMHSKGIAYRDLKPENTLIAENGYPKLIDMGFAKRIHNRRTYSMCGTPDYMAPEIIKRQGHGKGVDYWALGCMIFEMITNTSPFNNGNDPPQIVFQKVVEGRVKYPPFMSANAVDIVRRLLDPNPETRLGCHKNGAIEIKEHPFFTKEINFQLLIRQREEAPMVPPKILDFKSLCIPDDQPEPRETPLVNPTNWDDIF